MKKINVAYFNPEKPNLEFITIDDKLQKYYDLIGCQTIDITNIHGMNVVVDDNGLIFDRKPAYIRLKGLYTLCGPIVFTGPTDENGDLTDIQPEQIAFLKSLYIVHFPAGQCYFLLDRGE